MLGDQEKRKDKKTQKSKNEEKVLGLAQSPYSPQGNGWQSSRVETTGIDHLTRRRPREPVSSKAERTSENAAHSRYIHVKQE